MVEERLIQYVLVGLDDGDPARTAETAARICDVLHEKRASISSISSWLIIAVFGWPYTEPNDPEVRRETVQSLLQRLGEDVRIAHGECKALVGDLGSRQRVSFAPLIPGFHEINDRLRESPFGTALEVTNQTQPENN